MARIRSEDVPQADTLSDVLKTAEAVGNEALTSQAIARAIHKVDREGRYYRRAAEILGLIERVGTNVDSLTPRGEEFLRVPNREKDKIVASAVLGSRLIQRMIPFLESKQTTGVTRDELQAFICAVTEKAGPTMVPRRTSTVIAWLERIRMLTRKDDRYYLKKLPEGVELLDYGPPDEPLLPPRFDLQEYSSIEKAVSSAKAEITYSVDQAKRERADRSHQIITSLVAAKLRVAGAIPRRNQFVDLAASVREQPFIFEIKSTSTANAHSQIRRGVSQLYEYRYIQGAPDAKLVLVLENPIPSSLHWMLDYLIVDREILVAWDGDHRRLRCDGRQHDELLFLL